MTTPALGRSRIAPGRGSACGHPFEQNIGRLLHHPMTGELWKRTRMHSVGRCSRPPTAEACTSGSYPTRSWVTSRGPSEISPRHCPPKQSRSALDPACRHLAIDPEVVTRRQQKQRPRRAQFEPGCPAASRFVYDGLDKALSHESGRGWLQMRTTSGPETPKAAPGSLRKPPLTCCFTL